MSGQQIGSVGPELGLADAIGSVSGADVGRVRSSGHRHGLATVRASLRFRRTQIGIAVVGVLLAVAVVGPLVAPHAPTQFVGAPNSAPSGSAIFGTDALGRDVLSRFLHGGWTVVWMSGAATLVGVVLGAVVGLVAAYAGGWLDGVLMRVTDVLLAFPAIVFALLVVAIFGPSVWLIVICVALTHAPRVTRVLRGAGQEVVAREFVLAAEAVGERRWRILLNEVLPNVASPLLVETGLRVTYSIALVAALSFLGFGLQPPASDWGLMVNENRLAIGAQPWSVLVPVIAIGLLTVGTNLVTDGVARAVVGIDRQAEG
jgi:peptide/nickel transport system permease protein